MKFTIFDPDMATTDNNKVMRRRLANAYLSSVISISLVLLLVGLAAMLLVNAKGVSDYFKENMQVTVMMKQTVSEEQALDFQSDLNKERFIRNTFLVSKEQGRRELEKEQKAERGESVSLEGLTGIFIQKLTSFHLVANAAVNETAEPLFLGTGL